MHVPMGRYSVSVSAAETPATKPGGTYASIAQRKQKGEDGRLVLHNQGGRREQYEKALQDSG